MIDILVLLATASLGVFSGSLTIEGLVLVPFWRTLAPDEFYSFHHQFGRRLFRYFAPLTTAAVLMAVVAALPSGEPHVFTRRVAAALALLVLASFPLFFHKANRAFADRAVSDQDLPAALQRWSRVHSLRTLVALGSFVVSALALMA